MIRLRRTKNGVVARAPAKVNLYLDVLARRPDGYHEIESIVAPIDLYDRVLVRRTHSRGVTIATSGRPCPAGPDNLAYRAAEAVLAESGAEGGLAVDLHKRIPLGAGLGGGSSDAAATLFAARRALEAPIGHEDLCAIAARLGSDVPLFLADGWSVVRGRGEIVEPLAPSRTPTLWLLVVHPGGAAETGLVYRRLNLDLTRPKRDLKTVIQQMAFGEPSGVREFHNSLATPFRELYPEFSALLDRVESVAGRRFFLTGSGSAAFAPIAGPAEGRSLRSRLLAAQTGIDVFVCRTLSGESGRAGG